MLSQIIQHGAQVVVALGQVLAVLRHRGEVVGELLPDGDGLAKELRLRTLPRSASTRPRLSWFRPGPGGTPARPGSSATSFSRMSRAWRKAAFRIARSPQVVEQDAQVVEAPARSWRYARTLGKSAATSPRWRRPGDRPLPPPRAAPDRSARCPGCRGSWPGSGGTPARPGSRRRASPKCPGPGDRPLPPPAAFPSRFEGVAHAVEAMARSWRYAGTAGKSAARRAKIARAASKS